MASIGRVESLTKVKEGCLKKTGTIKKLEDIDKRIRAAIGLDCSFQGIFRLPGKILGFGKDGRMFSDYGSFLLI